MTRPDRRPRDSRGELVDDVVRSFDEGGDLLHSVAEREDVRGLLARAEVDRPNGPSWVRVGGGGSVASGCTGDRGDDRMADLEERRVGQRFDPERTPDLRMVRPTLEVLARDRVPQRRRIVERDTKSGTGSPAAFGSTSQ